LFVMLCNARGASHLCSKPARVRGAASEKKLYHATTFERTHAPIAWSLP